jgi:flavin reductase (DIM6/NTAB) family NADH-FMN oxidoreductase RutF
MREVSFGEAMKRKYPEWVVWIVTLDRRGQVDIMPAGWAMIVSGKPPMFAVAVGHGRYTHEMIQSGKEFVIAFPSPGMESATLFCGTKSGRDVNKLEHAKLVTVPSKRVQPPLIQGCIVNLECRLASATPAGDHTIFVGEVVASHVEDDVPKRLVNFGDNRFATATPDY